MINAISTSSTTIESLREELPDSTLIAIQQIAFIVTENARAIAQLAENPIFEPRSVYPAHRMVEGEMLTNMENMPSGLCNDLLIDINARSDEVNQDPANISWMVKKPKEYY